MLALLAGACGSTPRRAVPEPPPEPTVLRAGPGVGNGAAIRISYFRLRRDVGDAAIEDYAVLQSVTYTWHRGTPPVDVMSHLFQPEIGAAVPDDEILALWEQIQARGFLDLPAADPLALPPTAFTQRALDGTLLTVHAPGVDRAAFLPDRRRGTRDATDRFFEWLEPGLWYLRLRYAAKVTEAIHENDRPFDPPLRR